MASLGAFGRGGRPDRFRTAGPFRARVLRRGTHVGRASRAALGIRGRDGAGRGAGGAGRGGAIRARQPARAHRHDLSSTRRRWRPGGRGASSTTGRRPAGRSDRAQSGAARWFVALAIPAFVVGFFVFYGRVCPMPAAGDPLFGGLAGPGWDWRAVTCSLPPRFLLLALSQLVVVAIPEELFFRGYLMERLEQVWPPRRPARGPGGPGADRVERAVRARPPAVIPNPQRLAVFFPALLFGWMRARTGSIAAGATFHALCNVVSDVLHTSYFG